MRPCFGAIRPGVPQFEEFLAFGEGPLVSQKAVLGAFRGQLLLNSFRGTCSPSAPIFGTSPELAHQWFPAHG